MQQRGLTDDNVLHDSPYIPSTVPEEPEQLDTERNLISEGDNAQAESADNVDEVFKENTIFETRDRPKREMNKAINMIYRLEEM